MVFNINNFKRIYKSKITFTLAAKNAEKLTFLLISQARVNKFYIFPTMYYIVYLFFTSKSVDCKPIVTT